MEESWAECAQHAATIERILGLAKPVEAAVTAAEPAPPVGGQGATQGNLFGGVDAPGAKKRRKKPV